MVDIIILTRYFIGNTFQKQIGFAYYSYIVSNSILYCQNFLILTQLGLIMLYSPSLHRHCL